MQQENKVIVKLNCFPGPCRTGENRVSRFFVSDGGSSVRSKIGRCRITTFRQNTDFNVGLTPDLHAKQRGFTLIELLVVVLIIGILAGVALPQYQKAVYKSRATEAMNMVRALANAQEVYYMATGDYTNDISNLDIDISSSLIGTWPNPLFENKYSYACFEQRACGAIASSPSLPAFEIALQNKSNYGNAGKFYCHVADAIHKNNTAKQICQSLGREDTAFGQQYGFNAGKYFILN